MKKFLFDCGTRDTTASVGILALRIGTGLMMLLGHGIPKIQKFADAKDVFPVPNFYPFSLISNPVSLILTIGVEVICSALIILGLATRPATFLFAFTMIVAAFDIHSSGPWFMGQGEGSKEPALLYVIPALAIILTGAGKYSLDASVAKEGRRRKW